MSKRKIGTEFKPENSQVSGEINTVHVEIPCKNVLFVGGQERFICKMKKIYPHWEYLGTNQRNTKISKSFAIVIVKANHCSHNIIERALSFNQNAQVIYSNSTNIEKTLEEIKEGIRKLQPKVS